jgi:hypothetical protein
MMQFTCAVLCLCAGLFPLACFSLSVFSYTQFVIVPVYVLIGALASLLFPVSALSEQAIRREPGLPRTLYAICAVTSALCMVGLTMYTLICTSHGVVNLFIPLGRAGNSGPVVMSYAVLSYLASVPFGFLLDAIFITVRLALCRACCFCTEGYGRPSTDWYTTRFCMDEMGEPIQRQYQRRRTAESSNKSRLSVDHSSYSEAIPHNVRMSDGERSQDLVASPLRSVHFISEEVRTAVGASFSMGSTALGGASTLASPLLVERSMNGEQLQMANTGVHGAPSNGGTVSQYLPPQLSAGEYEEDSGAISSDEESMTRASITEAIAPPSARGSTVDVVRGQAKSKEEIFFSDF